MVSSCCGGRTLRDDAYIDKLTSKTLTRALTHRSTAANTHATNVKQNRVFLTSSQKGAEQEQKAGVSHQVQTTDVLKKARRFWP